jgi:hypothetical protein
MGQANTCSSLNPAQLQGRENCQKYANVIAPKPQQGTSMPAGAQGVLSSASGNNHKSSISHVFESMGDESRGVLMTLKIAPCMSAAAITCERSQHLAKRLSGVRLLRSIYT